MTQLLVPLRRLPCPEPVVGAAPSGLARWIALVAASDDPCLVLDREAVVVGVSASGARLLGRRAPDLLGRSLLDPSSVDLLGFTAAQDRVGDRGVAVPPVLALRTRGLCRQLMRVRTPEGEQVTLDAVAAPLHGPAEPTAAQAEGDDRQPLLGSLTFLARV